jgi:arginase
VVCQFDPDSGDGDLIAGIAIKGIMTLLKTLLERGVLKSKISA